MASNLGGGLGSLGHDLANPGGSQSSPNGGNSGGKYTNPNGVPVDQNPAPKLKPIPPVDTPDTNGGAVTPPPLDLSVDRCRTGGSQAARSVRYRWYWSASEHHWLCGYLRPVIKPDNLRSVSC